MTLRLSTDTPRKVLESRLGAEGVQELEELIIHTFLPETLRKKVVLTTPHLEMRLGEDGVRELRNLVERVAELASRGIEVQVVTPGRTEH